MTQCSAPKRIAICFSGLVRTYRETYQNFVESILAPNSGSHIDVFISTWPIELSNNSMERTRRIAWYGAESPPFAENTIDSYDLIDKYKPVSIQIEKPFTFPVDWYVPTPGINIQSLLSMVYKIYSCDVLRRNYEKTMGFKYDAVIRMRFDCLVPFPIVLDENFNLNVVTTPSMMQPRPFPDWDWVNDKIAIGNSEIIKTYSDWYLNFNKMIDRGVPLQPETLLAAHLTENNITYAPWGSEMEIIRPSGY